MIYPEFLKDGACIGFPAPSFGANIEPYKSRFTKALEVFRKEGFLPLPGTNAFRGDGIGISNTPHHCGAELTAMYLDGDIDGYISVGGGELMCEILEHVGFDRIRDSKAKWFMGYSDNTNFTFLLNTICDTASIYGPCAGDFCADPRPKYIQDALDLITGKKLEFKSYFEWEKESKVTAENPFEPFHPLEDRVHAIYNNGYFIPDARESDIAFSVTGRVIGGCMDCLATLVGTKFDKVKDFNKKYENDGIIWLLESCDLNVFAQRRAMWQMDNAGWFENVKAFVFGRPLNSETMMNLDKYEAVLEVARKKNVPVIMDADFGHYDPMMPVMMGSVAEFSVKGNEMSVKYMMK
ncbi:MAG: LD-carboxypeptidase [Lachnospiraceae bacterium]|nr:LD-carboxypeptidase [Lachnospiraceae bacterium]